MAKKIRAKIGDVFAVPIDEKTYGYGQIVAGGKPKCYVMYNIRSEEHPDINIITSSRIIFLAHTIDIRIEDGVWEVLGNYPVKQNIVLPEYKVDTPKGIMVTDYEGKLLRIATKEEEERLYTSKSHSPVAIEKSIKTWFGVGDPYPYIDELFYGHLRKM